MRAGSDRRLVDFDPDAATLAFVTLDPAGGNACLPVELFRRFLAGLLRTSSPAGGVTAFEVVAATDAAGTGATAVVQHALGFDPDAVGDFVWLETDADQLRQVLPDATHVGVRVQLAIATDECALYFERAEPFYAGQDPTEDHVA